MPVNSKPAKLAKAVGLRTKKLTRNRRGLGASGVKTKRHLVLDDRRIVGIGLSFASHVKA